MNPTSTATFSGLGWCTNASPVPGPYFASTGGKWQIISNLGVDGAAWASVSKVALSFGLKVLCVVRSVDEAVICSQLSVLGSQLGNIEIQYLNEPDQANQDPRTPAQYISGLKALLALGIKVWGPGLCTFAQSAWWKEFIALGGLKLLKGVAVHLYDSVTPDDWPVLVRMIRAEIGSLPLLISEAGPGKGLPPDQLAAWFARAIAVVKTLGVPVALYRLIDCGDESGLVSESAAGVFAALPAYGLLEKDLSAATA